MSERKSKDRRAPIFLPDRPIIPRIRKQVKLTPCGCLVWTGKRNKSGYGRIHWNGKKWFVHRAVYTEKIGPIPDGMVVCHTCDNPACCHPDHLFLGSQIDNIHERDRKGRTAKGPRTTASQTQEAAMHKF